MKISIEFHRSPQWTMLAAGVMDRRLGIVIGPLAMSVRVERTGPAYGY